MKQSELFEIFLGYYNEAIANSEKLEFKKSSDKFDKAFEVLQEIRSESLKKYSGKKLTRIKSPDEVEFERLKGIVIDLRNKVGDLIVELEDIEFSLGKFQVEYNSKLGSLFLELDKIEYQIILEKIRLEKLRGNQPEIDLNELIDKEQQFRDEEENIRKDREFIKDLLSDTKNLTDEKKVEIRTLYRDLAKIYHPDKARNDDEKVYFESVMKEINTAYRFFDFDLLKKIEAKAQVLLEFEQIGETMEEKIARLKEEERKLQQLLMSIHQQIDSIQNSDTSLLYHRVKNFQPNEQDYYFSIAEDLSNRIQRKKSELKRMKDSVELVSEEIR